MEALKITPITLIKPTPIVRGPKGESIKGEKGNDGSNGKRGKRGRRGKQGLQGEKGESIRGEKGKDGDPGKQGPKGEKGDRGLKGLRGLRGFKGNPGKDGEDGKDFNARELTEQDIAFLQDNLIGKLVKDVNIQDNQDKTLITIIYTIGKPTKIEITKPKAQTKVMKVGGSVTHQGGGRTDLQIIDEAEGGNSSGSYTSGKLTLITFADTDKYTNNTKTLNYTGDELTQTVNVFDYEGQTWTVTRGYTYLAGVWQTKSINIVKV